MKERVIDIDDKDRQVWALITDVPKVKTPWQYVCFILNVIIPGKNLKNNDIDLILHLLRIYFILTL